MFDNLKMDPCDYGINPRPERRPRFTPPHWPNFPPPLTDIPESTLTNLRERLARTRWPDEIPGSDWDYGSNLDYIKELVEYWRTGYDWRAQEAALNSLSHFKTSIEGQGIHSIHQRGQGPNPMPIVLTHGWPSTFFEMTKFIPRLTDPASFGGDPADSFDVVAPSMPGYGFSDQTRRRGVNTHKIADLWATLMTQELGYPRFAAQGGDWGAGVTSRLGYHHADKVIGIHATSVTQAIAYQGEGSRELDQRELDMLQQRAAWAQAEGGYSHRAPSPKPCPTASTTPPPGCAPGLWRSSALGATATATWRAGIPRTSC